MTPEEQAAAELAAANLALAAAKEEAEEGEGVDLQNNDPAYLRRVASAAHSESASRRIKITEQKQKIAALEAKSAAAEAALNEHTKKKLEEEGKIQELRAMENAQAAKVIQQLQDQTVAVTLEAKMLTAGIPPKYMKMIDKDGIGVDALGRVTGVDDAIAVFKRENPELIIKATPPAAPGAPAAGAAPAAGTTPAARPNPADGMIGVMDLNALAKLRNVANAGKDPEPAGTTPQPQKVNVRNMTPKEKDKAYADYRSKL
jgi:hypothetical protein